MLVKFRGAFVNPDGFIRAQVITRLMEGRERYFLTITSVMEEIHLVYSDSNQIERDLKPLGFVNVDQENYFNPRNILLITQSENTHKFHTYKWKLTIYTRGSKNPVTLNIKGSLEKDAIISRLSGE